MSGNQIIQSKMYKTSTKKTTNPTLFFSLLQPTEGSPRPRRSAPRVWQRGPRRPRRPDGPRPGRSPCRGQRGPLLGHPGPPDDPRLGGPAHLGAALGQPARPGQRLLLPRGRRPVRRRGRPGHPRGRPRGRGRGTRGGAIRGRGPAGADNGALDGPGGPAVRRAVREGARRGADQAGRGHELQADPAAGRSGHQSARLLRQVYRGHRQVRVHQEAAQVRDWFLLFFFSFFFLLLGECHYQPFG